MTHPLAELYANVLCAVAADHQIGAYFIGNTRYRSASVARARQDLCWRLRQRGLSFQDIADLLGAHHTTVMWNVRRHGARSETLAWLREAVKKVREGNDKDAPCDLLRAAELLGVI